MPKPDTHRILELQELLNAFASIERIVHVKRQGRHTLESDTEHSYNLAMTAWFIAEYFPHINKDKAIRIALVHDLVEIHAGDTFAFADKDTLASKADREAAAQKKLATEWKDFPDMHRAIDDYETKSSPEAKFVYALDKLMPMFAIYLNEGHTWHQNGLTLERLAEVKAAKVKVSPEIQPYWNELHKLLLQSPHLLPAPRKK